ncbi:AF4/FMR2 family member lilli, partial [Anopheles marshallii]|uniref:AF4/FMR2 family member lilli n=1 Tax=Anopheles marshallii TaxID=1521116 RepID=UPI00237A13EA
LEYAWVTLATNDSYSLGALVVAHSLKRVHTVHQMAVLITPGVSEAMKTKLRAVFNVVEEVNLLDSKDAANLALLKRPELGVTFTKLHCWRLTQFEKCVFLDADTLVLRNSDELFEREELSAAPDIGWPDCFNSGVYVFRPNLETFSSLLQYAVTHGSFDGGDQGLLNAYFSDWAHKDIQKHLPFIYNTSSVATYSYLPAFKQFGQNTKILHFIGTVKPWLQNFNSETRKVYVPSEYQHLANFLQYWWDIFAEDVHSRLSPDMQRALAHWIKPLHKVSVNQSRSTPLSTVYFTHEADNDSQMLCWQYQDNYQEHHHQHQQQQREGFVVSYDPETGYKDPWEDYLQRQEREKVLRKQEEERLYFQYLNELRAQEHRSRTQYELSLVNTQHEHHEQSPYHDIPHYAAQQQHQDPHRGADGGHTERGHHHDHHDTNAFQRTDQWVDRMVQQHQENVGHWEKHSGEMVFAVRQQESPHFRTVDHNAGNNASNRVILPDSNNNITVGDSASNANAGSKSTDLEQHKTYPPSSSSQQEPTNQQKPSQSERESDAGGNVGDVSGLAGALAQLHLGEAKSKEQEAYEEHMRRQCWETGNIDYMGRDSFENIWKRIQQTLNSGAGSGAEDKAESSSAVETVSPAPTQRTSRRPSRSRSATPKRDPKDRSPTPQPEDKKPVDKKEVLVVPPPIIAEEDDVAISLSSIESTHAMRTQAKLPPPIQYDPTTNTTTLTKKVFAGYRQIITTKSPEGKTRTHEKLVYDPSIEDDREKSDREVDQRSTALDASQKILKQDVVDGAASTTATPPLARVDAKEQSQKQAGTSEKVPPKRERQMPSTAPEASSNVSAYQPTIPKSTPKPVATPAAPAPAQQQVAQESIAGKPNALADTKQPVKALRKKRHISPQSRPQQTTTNAASTTQAPGKPSPSSSSSSLTSASRNDHPANQKASVVTAISSAIGSPSPTVSSSMAKTSYSPITPHTSTALGDEKVSPILTPPSPDMTLPSVQQQSSSPPQLNTQPSAQTKQTQPVAEGVRVGSPPVPPRRKRESRATKLEKTKKSKLVQLLLSCISCSKKKR